MSKTRENALEELRSSTRTSMEMVDKRVLSCLILNSMAGSVGRPKSFFVQTFRALALSAVLAGLGLAANVMLGVLPTRASYFGLSASSLLLGASFLAVKGMYDFTFPEQIDRILNLIADEDGFTKLKGWFDQTFRLVPQLLVSIGMASAAVMTLSLYNLGAQLDWSFGLKITVFGGMFGVGNGFYCALTIPTLARTLSGLKLILYRYNPAASVGVLALSAIFGKLSLANGVGSTAVIALIFLAGSLAGESALPLSIGWMVLGWGTVTYSFFFPHAFLSWVVREKRFRSLEKLDSSIHRLQTGRSSSGEDPEQTLAELVELRQLVQRSSSTTIDFAGLSHYLGSLVLPMLSFLAGIQAQK